MRILFVAHPCSIHTARWINQLPLDEWDVHLFPVHDGDVHLDLQNITVHSFFRSWPPAENPRIRRHGITYPLVRGRGLIQRSLRLAMPGTCSAAARLARVIATIKPDIIHVLEMQSAGYLTLEAFRLSNGARRPPCIYSSWGSDLYLYGPQPAHKSRISAFLAECDYHIADCHRDEALAVDFGFRGEALGVLPTAGGYNLNQMRKFVSPGPPSSRRVIALKGYQDVRGANSLEAIRALRECIDGLTTYEVIVFSASEAVRQKLNELQRVGLRISQLPASPHVEMLKMFGSARAAIGVGSSDGTPNAMLEAMVMGAFPIQTDTGSTAEWIMHGRNGFLVTPDAESIREAVRRVINEDELIDYAARINAELTERIDARFIQPKVIGIYERVAAAVRGGRTDGLNKRKRVLV